MDRLPVLTDEDRVAIEAAASEQITLAHLQRHVALQVACVTRFLESGQMAAKDVIVALNKIGSQISSAVQLGLATTATAPGDIKITWEDGNRMSAPPRPEIADRKVRAKDPVAGALVDCD